MGSSSSTSSPTSETDKSTPSASSEVSVVGDDKNDSIILNKLKSEILSTTEEVKNKKYILSALELDIQKLQDTRDNMRREQKIYENEWETKRKMQLEEQQELEEKIINMKYEIMKCSETIHKQEVSENITMNNNSATRLEICAPIDCSLINYYFRCRLDVQFEILQVKRILNKSKLDAYLLTKAKFIQVHKMKNVCEKGFFRVISNKGISNLMDGGDEPLLMKGMVYLHAHPRYADRYYKNPTTIKRLMMVYVLFCLKCKLKNSQLKFEDDKLVSICYDGEHVLPTHIIEYE